MATRRKTRTSKPRTREIAGVRFTCIRPGLWISPDRLFIVVRTRRFWELYRTKGTKEPPLNDMARGWFLWASSELLGSVRAMRHLTKGLMSGVRGTDETVATLACAYQPHNKVPLKEVVVAPESRHLRILREDD